MSSVGKWDLSAPADGSFRASVFYIGESNITSENMAHELGHNLGLTHASTVPCVPASLADPALSCNTQYYLPDPTDTMGSAGNYQHFSSAFKSSLSWYDPAQVQDVTASGEYTLDQFELPSNGAKVLRIPLGKDSSGVETYYWVEFRTPGTFNTEQSVQVRYQTSAAYNGSSMSSDPLRFTGAALVTGSGAISGKVVKESDGSAVPQAYVQLLETGSGYARYLTETLTNSSGRYVFKGLTPGTYYLSTYNYEGLVDEYYSNARNLNSATPVKVVSDQETSGIDIALAPGNMLSGVITREPDGLPIPSVSVYAYDNSWNGIRSGYTDSSGRYYIPGLPAGKYFLEANSYNSAGFGYVRAYYIDAVRSSSATSISLGPPERLDSVDFSLTPAGAISGQVLREADKVPIPSVTVGATDADWNWISSAQTGADGRYIIRNLPPGGFFLQTYNSQGYTNEYYKDTTSRASATAVQVTKASETTGIDFLLAKSSAPTSESGLDQSMNDWIGPAEEIGRGPAVASGMMPPAPPLLARWGGGRDRIEASDVTSATPFVDPYRGVKIEYLEATGSGAAARAKLKVSFSKLQIGSPHTFIFEQFPIGGRQAKELAVTNQNATPVKIGTPGIEGRNAANFKISKDGCAGASLGSGANCKIELSFSPEHYSGNTAGEFAFLRVPTDDSVFGTPSIDLWGRTLAADLRVAQSPSWPIVVGRSSSFYIYIYSTGTVGFSDVVTITDRLPAGFRFISGSSGWNCSANGQDVTCSRSLNLPMGYMVSLQLNVDVMPEAAPYFVNKVVASSPSDANPDNNSSVVSTTVDPGSGTLYGVNLLKADGTYTGIALYNASTATAALSLYALDQNGTIRQPAGMTNPANRVLKRGEQLPVMDDQVWTFPAGEKSKMSWFAVTSSISKVFGFILAFDDALQVLDGTTLFRSFTGTAILPDIATSDFTRVYILNPNDEQLGLTIDLISAEGNRRATASRRLERYASLYETLPELFTTAAAAETDYIRITGDRNFLAMESMGVTSRWIRALGAQDAGGGAKVLYASQYATGGPDWRTSITVVNLDSTAAQIKAKLTDDDGNQIGQTVQIPIKAYGKVVLSGQTLFRDAGDILTQGYVEVTGDGARLVGSVTFGDRQGTYSAALPLQAATYRELVFGHAASNSLWYTGIAVANPNGSDITATFQLFDKTGQLVDSKTEVIKARQRRVKLLTSLFPKIENADVTSGYIRVSSDNVLVGCALFGTSGGTVLSAIPPHTIR